MQGSALEKVSSSHQAATPGAGKVSVTVAGDEGSVRLDRVLAVRVPDLSRSRLKALILAGSVSVGTVPVRDPAYHAAPVAAPAEPGPENIALDIVYEDDDIVVIDKPKGLVVHPAAGHETGTLVNALIAHCGASLSGIGGVRRPGIVHRLDKDTTGLLVVAKTDEAHAGLSRQFAAHGADGKLERRYRAIVWGAPERPRGSIDAALARSSTNRTRIAVVGADAGRRAVTHYQVLERYGGGKTKPIASLLELELETGRTHQIRVHLAHIGHPLLGDMTYGSGFKASARNLGPEAQAALEALGRQALHAGLLAFVHPATGKRLRFTSPLPADMARLAAALGSREAPAPGPAAARRQ
jgi:23S rRNA pseudouridine1911/1915/1917 synthase